MEMRELETSTVQRDADETQEFIVDEARTAAALLRASQPDETNDPEDAEVQGVLERMRVMRAPEGSAYAGDEVLLLEVCETILRRIGRLTEVKDANGEVFKKEIARLVDRHAMIQAPLKAKIERYEKELEAAGKQLLELRPSKKSRTLLYGAIGTRKAPDTVIVEDEALVKASLPSVVLSSVFIPKDPTLNKPALLKYLKQLAAQKQPEVADADGVPVEPTGVVIKGAHIEEGKPQFHYAVIQDA